MRGKFITFEGGEGSGKSTVIKDLTAKFVAEKIPFILTREPGGTPISEQIRNVILDKANKEMDPITEAYLYAASRRQHVAEKIKPALEAGKNVLCDRYLDSSLAYQGGARGLGIDRILSLNQEAIDGLYPDLTLLFDLDPEIGLRRISDNSGREVNRLDLEKLSFHQAVRAAFHELAERFSDRYVIIDASLSLPEVEAACFSAITKVLA